MVLKIKGDSLNVKNALEELESLYNNPNKHMIICKLTKAPKPNETPQIIAYVRATFDCKA
jgi:hypothetical protein